jgi:signal peptidase II
MNSGQDAGVRPRRIGVLIAIAVTALALDVITKAIVVATLPDRPPIELLGGLLTLRVLRNSGAAFNIGNGMTIVFTVIATGVVVAILRYARRLRSLPWAITLGLLLGGALGNLADRLLRSPGIFRGHVVDWIELPHWPVFNLAVASIVCGGVLAVLLASRGLQVDGTVQRDDPPEPPSGSGTAPRTDQKPEPAPASAPSDDVSERREDHSDGSRPDARH